MPYMGHVKSNKPASQKIFCGGTPSSVISVAALLWQIQGGPHPSLSHSCGASPKP
jgi:hypothetical protein